MNWDTITWVAMGATDFVLLVVVFLLWNARP
jgi:hypothetical protein